MKKILFALCALLVVGLLSAQAVTITNRGQVITISVMDEDIGGDATITKSMSKVPQAGTDRSGLYVITGTIPIGSATGDISADVIPKGMWLLDNAIIEVNAEDATVTNCTLAVGGVTLSTTVDDVDEAIVYTAVPTAAVTTSADSISYTIAGDVPDSEINVTVYLPVILTNDL